MTLAACWLIILRPLLLTHVCDVSRTISDYADTFLIAVVLNKY